MTVLSLRGVRKIYRGSVGSTVGVLGIDLDVERGEFVTLLGPSGCGKTTTLRCIAGLEVPDAGEITIDGRTVFAGKAAGRPQVNVPAEARGLSMVFQNYALWPHMNVFQNVAFGLSRGRYTRAQTIERVDQVLRSVGLAGYQERRISELSGGQQQRVAVARAMAPDPKLILFDEPLSNVDTQLRETMRHEIGDLQDRMGLTAVWVTHDQSEALAMSSRVVVMSEGKVDQIDSPQEIWDHPATAFVAGFVGSPNVLRGQVKSGAKSPDGGPVVLTDEGLEMSLGHEALLRQGERVAIYVRPDAVFIEEGGEGAAVNTWKGKVLQERFYGDHTLSVVDVAGWHCNVRSASRFEPGTVVSVHIPTTSVSGFPVSGEPIEEATA